jgi:hypothetical protein
MFPVSFHPKKITGHVVEYIDLGSPKKTETYRSFWLKCDKENGVVVKSMFSHPQIPTILILPHNSVSIGYCNIL